MTPIALCLESTLALHLREEVRARTSYAAASRVQGQTAVLLAQARAKCDRVRAALASHRGAGRERTLLNALQHQQAQCTALGTRLAAVERERSARRSEWIDARRRREALPGLAENCGG
ncbi:MAG TPA: hypothetical protein VFD27_17105 [Chthoniobacteraceae bacterium]|nr:hypothetical protein [Chthoniobacteraceae bacterium]